ncbi:unnamed protein product [Didymodactylos carnosus]|uniref:Uncharacterized protein n=1 Tax=Didymodactylos carnosus TaxID=1234261 RepID=A0A8S2H9B4_9BILA|nr:unnamed protein product [Didymodactylos carnosus]CAF3617206.1 unnamed protein product [Didymodactylos carnosus]
MVRQATNDYLDLQKTFLEDLSQLDFGNEHVLNIISSDLKRVTNTQSTFDQIQLVLCGPNSSGKTSFLHAFLKIDPILPTDSGPVSARIIRLTYAPRESAYLREYSSFKLKHTRDDLKDTVNLTNFFREGEEPDWRGIEDAIRKYIQRPEKESDVDFANWAKHFVEIGLPSPTLELGINVYDTPGFLFHESENVLKENLHELVRTIHPTIVFMYDNSTIANDANDCYLALKSALNSLEDIHIFFLNTKVDPNVVLADAGINLHNKKQVTDEKFREALPKAREKCYELLRKAPAMVNEGASGLPASLNDCDHFDICSIPQPESCLFSSAEAMTENTVRRIVQFATRTDLIETSHILDSVLPTVEAFFDFALTTSHREPSQWQKLRADANMWGEYFFAQLEEQFSLIMVTAYTNILSRFDERSPSIAERSARLDRTSDPMQTHLQKSKKVKEFIKIAVQEEVIKAAVNEIISETKNSLRKSISKFIVRNAEKNELLIAAQRAILTDLSSTDIEQRNWFERLRDHVSMLPSIFKRFFKTIRTLPNVERWNKQATADFSSEQSFYEYADALDSSENLIDDAKRREFSNKYLLKVKSKLEKFEKIFERNLNEWIKSKKLSFAKQIEQNYNLALKCLAVRKTAYELSNRYSGQFARIECKLLAARDLVKFNGVVPNIDESTFLGSGSFFRVHEAQWGSKTELVVKRLKEPLSEYPYIQYLEAHYHRKITRLELPHTGPLLYLYECPSEDQGTDGDLWIFLPKYKWTLSDYLKQNIKEIKVDKVLQISLDIAHVVDELHSNELVHRDIKANNILLDENDVCYLCDFGTCKEGTLNSTILGTMPVAPELYAQRYDPSFAYDGKAVDIFAFGLLMYELLPKAKYHRPHISNSNEIKEFLKKVYPIEKKKEYERVLEMCLQQEAKARPNAHEIVEKLEEIQMSLREMKKECKICMDESTKLRFYPCGHKVMCESCLNDLRQKSKNREVICTHCNQKVERWEEDDKDDTFYVKKGYQI